MQKVHEWLTTAAAVPGFIGFAVGRTSFWDPLVAWRARKSVASRRFRPSRAGIASLWTRSRSKIG